MKTVLTTIIAIFALSFAFAKEVEKSGVQQPLSFETVELNLGIVKLKEKRKSIFRFENCSSKPVVIIGTQTTCGCTDVSYTKRPVKPHAIDSVVVVFKPDQRGAFYKKIKLKDNNNQNPTLLIRGVVE